MSKPCDKLALFAVILLTFGVALAVVRSVVDTTKLREAYDLSLKQERSDNAALREALEKCGCRP
jgi:flagellar biosynthesis/type III secretory pathway M-ring protein FliF/YscJ